MKKLYAECDGVQYYGYDLYVVEEPYWLKNSQCLIDGTTQRKLEEMIESMKKSTFVPSKGDEICVIPDCKYNLEDVRRNYKIKRGCDNGTCNVFSSETVSRMSSSNSYLVAVIPSRKAAVIYLYMDSQKIREKAQNIFPTLRGKDIIFLKNGTSDWTHLYCSNIHEAYIKLLEGTLTKPCVHIDSLDLNTGEDLTLDSLQIVHRLCMEGPNCGYYFGDGYDENLKVQLAALNNMDWRKYPGTIDVLMNGFMWHANHAIYQMKSHASRYPKNIRNILTFHSDRFDSAEDRKLACRFMRDAMKLEGVEFTNLQDVWSKLDEHRVNPLTFLRLFDNMVRLRDKEKGDE